MTLPKPISYALRLAITAGALTLAFSHVPMRDVQPMLNSIPFYYLLLAFLLTHAGQVLSALRTRYYLRCQNIDLATVPSLKLHYVGALFNAFLPGGAGGDAYKAWWLKKYHEGKLLNMAILMVANRLNGLWALCIWACITAFFSAPIRALHPQSGPLILAAMILGTIAYGILARFALREPLRQQLHAGAYSIIIQLILVGIAYVLCLGLGLQDNALEYITLFMLSCILAMMPISIGGIGVRELALLQGSKLLGLSEHAGVTLGFCFTLLTLTITLVGAIVHHSNAQERA